MQVREADGRAADPHKFTVATDFSRVLAAVGKGLLDTCLPTDLYGDAGSKLNKAFTLASGCVTSEPCERKHDVIC